MNNRIDKQVMISGVFFISLFLLLYSNLQQSAKFGMWALIILGFSIFFYFIYDISKRISLVFYVLCIFTFLVSRQIINFFSGEDYMQGFSEEVFITSCNCIFISCLCVLIGFCLKPKIKIKFAHSGKKLWTQYLTANNYNMKKVNLYSFLLACISVLIACFFSSEQLSYVLDNGYLSIYGYSSSFSNMANRFWLVGRTSVFICLTSNPSPKRARIAVALGAIEPCIQFVIGRRGYIVSYALFCIFFVISYWKEYNEKEKKLNRRILLLGIAVLAGGAVFLPFLYSYGYTRSGYSYESYNNIFEGIGKFFYSQGVSYHVLGITIDKYGKLPQTMYSLGIIKDIFTGVLNEYTDHTVAFAMHSSQLRAYVSYIDNSYVYLNGQGLGSSYIAEVFYDFSYPGLIIVNLLLGYVLNRVKELKAKNFIGLSLLLGFFYDIMLLPRAPLCSPFLNMFSTSTIATYLLIIFLTYKKDLSTKGEQI